LQRIDQVILLNWHIRILEKQIEYGSQLGDTVLQLARMELKNYSKNVLAVAEYFDQLGKLTVVDGERQPTEVYEDFLGAVDTALANAKGGPLGGLAIPLPKSKREAAAANGVGGKGGGGVVSAAQVPVVLGGDKKVIWVIGGPGSNKSLLSSTSIRLHHAGGWEFLSVGEELRRLCAGGNKAKGGGGLSPDQLVNIRGALNKGELVGNEIVLSLLGEAMGRSRKRGFLIDGFPRNYQQVELFRSSFPLLNPPPPAILVDCSEVELGRSLGQRANSRLTQHHREDDHNGAAVKRRLELYRTVTLPTLKILDDQHRLHIVSPIH
jgi:adenylate kinase family enzyme